MSKEAMKLALEALEDTLSDDPYPYSLESKAITALKEALAKPDFWEGYVPEPDSTCNNTLRAQGKAYPRTCKKCGFGPCVGLAQQALDKKAENARELGLDYEPVWNNLPSNKDVEDAMRLKRLSQLAEQPAQQEPVAWCVINNGEIIGEPTLYRDNAEEILEGQIEGCGSEIAPLYASPQLAQRTWVGLVWGELPEDGQNHDFLRGAVWAEAKLKEKNT